MFSFTRLVIPDIQILGPSHPVREGDNVNLTCIINEGSPKPEVRWFKNKKFLDEQKNTTLILTEVTREDEGRYICKAKNKAGNAKDNIYVTVDSK